MKVISFLVLIAVFGVTIAIPKPIPNLGAALAGKPVTTIKDVRQPLDGEGNYKYDIELSDGTKLEQEGKTDAPLPGESEGSLVVKGSYSYISPDGTPVSVSYTADKDGFKPVYESVPKSG